MQEAVTNVFWNSLQLTHSPLSVGPQTPPAWGWPAPRGSFSPEREGPSVSRPAARAAWCPPQQAGRVRRTRPPASHIPPRGAPGSLGAEPSLALRAGGGKVATPSGGSSPAAGPSGAPPLFLGAPGGRDAGLCTQDAEGSWVCRAQEHWAPGAGAPRGGGEQSRPMGALSGSRPFAACRPASANQRVIYTVLEWEPLLDSSDMTITKWVQIAQTIEVAGECTGRNWVSGRG